MQGTTFDWKNYVYSRALYIFLDETIASGREQIREEIPLFVSF